MKTRKLYWENPNLQSFLADILEVAPYEKNPNQFTVILDQTAFYPEGGGQPWDEGYIGNCFVSYVYEEDDKVYHVVDQIPSAKKDVSCTINWERRFDLMQQHLGQHILSSVFEKRYNATTVGFHLGSEFVTIDVDKPSFSWEEVAEVEQDVNAIIFRNIPVHTHFPSKEELSSFPLRKPPKVEDGIRIVEVDKTDFSPCGGVHPSHTGSVGLLKIRRWERMKGNMRIEFVCGGRALKDFFWKNQQIYEASNLLSIKEVEVFETVEKMFYEIKSLNKDLKTIKGEVLQYRAQDLWTEAEEVGPYRVIQRVFFNEDFSDLRLLSSALSQYPKTILLLGTKTDKAQIVFARSEDVAIDMNVLFKEVISLINGRGGGSPSCAQGGGDGVEKIEELIKTAYQKLISEYIHNQA